MIIQANIVTESRSVFACGWSGCMAGTWNGKITQGYQETFGGDGYVHFLDCGDGFQVYN